tara:strand:+ start:160 stop:354 length:195 start_codon:yes stop_codon:yes gene_type:complete
MPDETVETPSTDSGIVLEDKKPFSIWKWIKLIFIVALIAAFIYFVMNPDKVRAITDTFLGNIVS